MPLENLLDDLFERNELIPFGQDLLLSAYAQQCEGLRVSLHTNHKTTTFHAQTLPLKYNPPLFQLESNPPSISMQAFAKFQTFRLNLALLLFLGMPAQIQPKT